MRDLSKYFISQAGTIKDAVNIIDASDGQIALVVDDNYKLLGTVTDGDVRRALLKNVPFDGHVGDIMCRSFRYLTVGATNSDALTFMRRHMIHQVPIIDGKQEIIGLVLLNDLIKSINRSNPVVIMAGGEGKRMRPLTENCPKPMLRLGGKPLLEIIIDNCIKSGFENFYISVNYLKSHIQEHFGDGKSLNINIHYLEEDFPLGTAGALSMLPQRPTEPFLVLNGDVLTRVDYGRLLDSHFENKSKATICVREYQTQIPFGVVEINGSCVSSIVEKPLLSKYINAGIYVLDPDVLGMIPRNNYFDMPQLIEALVSKKENVSAFPVHEYWLDLGHPEALELAKRDWL